MQGPLVDGPYNGGYLSSNEEIVYVEAKYKMWSKGPHEKALSTIITGRYCWSAEKKLFLYERIAYVIRND